jgi:hypothetical protein
MPKFRYDDSYDYGNVESRIAAVEAAAARAGGKCITTRDWSTGCAVVYIVVPTEDHALFFKASLPDGCVCADAKFQTESLPDVDCERSINRCVDALEITRIVIAHRPETIAIADRVVRLAEGRPVAD